MTRASSTAVLLCCFCLLLQCSALPATLPSYDKWNYTRAILNGEETDAVLKCAPLAAAWPREECDIPTGISDLRVTNVTEVPLLLQDNLSIVDMIKRKVDELSKLKGSEEVHAFVLTQVLLFVEVKIPLEEPRAKLTVLAAGTALSVVANRISYWGGRGLMELNLWKEGLPQASILIGAIPYLYDYSPPGTVASVETEKMKRNIADPEFGSLDAIEAVDGV